MDQGTAFRALFCRSRAAFARRFVFNLDAIHRAVAENVFAVVQNQTIGN